MSEKIKILLADDHEIVREGIKLIINAQPDMHVTGEADNGETALQLVRENPPDLVVLDVSMPRMNGLKAAAAIIKCCPDIKILTLTRHTDDGYLQELLKAGVSGYILKQSAPSELINAIRAVIDGHKYLDPAITNKVIGGFAARQRNSGAPAGELVTERETEVLRQIALGFSNKEIAFKMNISVKTVEAHKANAMRKLNMKSRIDIVRYAILQNWMNEN